MARRFGFRTRRFVRPQRRVKWAEHTEFDVFSLTDATPNATNVHELLSPTDYSSNDLVSPNGVTLVRLVGDLALAFVPPTGAGNLDFMQFWWGIAVADKDVDPTSLDPSTLNPQSRVAERWLVLHHVMWAGGDWNFEKVWPIDLRVRARLRDASLFLVCTGMNNYGGETLDTIAVPYSFGARMLLRGDIT